MTPTPVTVTRFGGLDLASSPSLIPFERAMDCLNVEFSARGSIRTRGGYARFSVADLTNRAASLSGFTTTGATKQVLAGCGTRLEALDSAGAVVASATGLTNATWSFARVGTPNSEAAYAGNGSDTLRKWDGSTWSTPTATVNGVAAQDMPKGGLLAVDSDSNRLVVTGFATTTGGPDGATSSPSHIYWSEPGDPEAYNTTNSIQLSPGDGEKITALTTWQSYVLAFKPSKVWSFWGESLNVAGDPVFDYRAVDNSVGAVGPKAVCSTPDGVFFLDKTGVYLTKGGQPQRVSEPIDSFFEGKAQQYFRSQPFNHGAAVQSALAWHNNRLYVSVPTGASTVNDRVLVFDPAGGTWSIYDLPAAGLVSFALASQPELVFARSSGTQTIARHKTGEDRYSADDMTADGQGGTAITTRWRSGWGDLGTQTEKRITNAELYGTGTATVRLWRDYDHTDDVDGHTETLVFTTEDSLWDVMEWDVDVWGPSATIARKVWQQSRQATTLSLELSNSTLGESWQLNVCTFFLNAAPVPNLKSR